MKERNGLSNLAEQDTELLEDETQQATPPQLPMRLLHLPTTITAGTDELNFAEFPLSKLSDKNDSGSKTIEFEDQVFDKSLNQYVPRKVIITASDKFGLPTPIDEKVLTACLQCADQQKFTRKRVYFTPHRLLQLLKWPNTGQSYARLKLAFERWMTVTIFYKNSWRDYRADKPRWRNESFHILARSVMEGSGREDSEGGEGGLEMDMAFFEWSDVVFESFKKGNLKGLNFDFYITLKSDVARRLFRFLDKRSYHKDELVFDLAVLAYEKVGFSKNTPPPDLKRKLNKAIDELEERGFLEPIPPKERYRKKSKGHYDVVFRVKNSVAGEKASDIQATNLHKTLVERLIDFGVKENVAYDLVGRHSKELIEDKLGAALWMVRNNHKGITKNPAGFLVSSFGNAENKPYGEPKAYKETKESDQKRKIAEENRKKQVEAAAFEQKRKDLKQQAIRAGIQTYVDALTPDERTTLEKNAFDSANEGAKKMILKGGLVGETAKQNAVDRLVLNILNGSSKSITDDK